MDVYELLGDAGQVPEETLRFAKTYEAVLDLFQDGDFSAAHTAAIELGDERPDDLSVLRLIDECERYLKEPPPKPWDGATRLDTKF